MFEVIPYPENGRALIEDLIDDIKKSGNQKDYADLRRYAENLAKYGLEMNQKFKAKSFKKLEDNMYELRPKNFRVMFTKKDDIFYLLNGFYKKSNQTPDKEKKLARKLINEIL